jgi:hypothetical protein
MPRNLATYVQTGDQAASQTGGPSAANSGQSDNQLLQAVVTLLSPPKPLGQPTTLGLNSTGSPSALIDPMPSNVRLFVVTNNSAKTIYIWWNRATTVPANNTIAIAGNGGVRSFPISVSAIYVAGTAGDATASVTLELYG